MSECWWGGLFTTANLLRKHSLHPFSCKMLNKSRTYLSIDANLCEELVLNIAFRHTVFTFLS